ncbi:MAG TPA: hypothetical protein VHW01_03955 [Polyangiaceae bacterium]|nr:hypothetical protein [Polyangiaceae bacterium]
MTDILATATDPAALVASVLNPPLATLQADAAGLVAALGQVALIDAWITAHPHVLRWTPAPNPHAIVDANDTKRDRLTTNRAQVNVFLTALDSVRFDLSGSAVSALVARVAPARAGVATALTGIASVGLGALPAAAAALAAAEATAKAVGSDLDALASALALPGLEVV